MLLSKAKFFTLLGIFFVLCLVAGASIVVGITKPLFSNSFAPNPFKKPLSSLGHYMGIWDWYPTNASVLESLMSGIGIVSLIVFAIGVFGGWLSRCRIQELNQVSRSLRLERLHDEYRE